jgi:hypothetical protein
MLDHEVVEKFKEFQQKTGKYLDLVIENIRFEKVSLSNEDYFNFIKGKNKYIQRYIKNNHGEYPIVGSSLKNSCISAHIKYIDLSDVIDEKCVSFNKDNAKGSIPFLRDYPFLMDRHHIAIVPTNLVDAHYLQKSLIYYFEKKHFGWGDNVATVEEVSKHAVPIPRDLNKKYTSNELQKIIVEFLEYGFDWLDGIKANIDKQNDIYKRLRKSLIPSTFKRDYIKVRFARYAKKYGINFDITDIEFEKELIDNLIISKGASGKYKKDYYKNNKGQFSLYTGSKEIVAHVKEINFTDIIDIESVSFNKDNDAGTKAFYHNTPYIIGGHHYCLSIKEDKKNEIMTKYFYYCMSNIFIKNKFYQSRQPVANIGLIKSFSVDIPKSLKKYTSYEIQKIITDFINEVDDEIQQSLDKIDKGYDAIKRYKRAYLARTFSLIEWSK